MSGLATSHNQYGLGVPLIGVRVTDPKKEDRQPQERFHPDEMAFALTAFLVPNSRLRDPGENVDEVRKCTLALVDPVRQRTVGEAPNLIALETDLTTPLAYMWSRTDLDRFRWSGLLRPEQGLQRANLLMIRPYEPGKIPVVMVHGLISSPLAWIPMLNELLRDPAIQQKYQFMLYMYPTGVPMPIAAASLRDALSQAKMTFNPDGRDPAFDRMVLLGHSMGGLLSHFMTVSSGDQLWRLYSDKSFDEILGPKNVLDELNKLLFFEPLPFVSRVVFLATPHRGSDLSRGDRRPRGSGTDQRSRLYRQAALSTGRGQPRRLRPPPLPPLPHQHRDPRPELADPEGLAGHEAGTRASSSIRSSARFGPAAVDDTTDGVVPYRSAHLDETCAISARVESEKVVRSDHGVQKDGEAIREVRAILREHIGLKIETARSGREAPVQRAATTPAAATAAAPRARAASFLAQVSGRPACCLAGPALRLVNFELGTHRCLDLTRLRFLRCTASWRIGWLSLPSERGSRTSPPRW